VTPATVAAARAAVAEAAEHMGRSMSPTGLGEPEGQFVTYGLGVSLMRMRDTSAARGRAPVGAPTGPDGVRAVSG
jgi:hypothetical protein